FSSTSIRDRADGRAGVSPWRLHGDAPRRTRAQDRRAAADAVTTNVLRFEHPDAVGKVEARVERFGRLWLTVDEGDAPHGAETVAGADSTWADDETEVGIVERSVRVDAEPERAAGRKGLRSEMLAGRRLEDAADEVAVGVELADHAADDARHVERSMRRRHDRVRRGDAGGEQLLANGVDEGRAGVIRAAPPPAAGI